MESHAPKPQPARSFRISLTLAERGTRLDQALLEALRNQNENRYLKAITRSEFKELFNKRRIQIKGQNAKPSSSLASGVTTVDILGYEQKTD